MNKQIRNEIQFHLDRLKALASYIEAGPRSITPEESDWIEATWEYTEWSQESVMYDG